MAYRCPAPPPISYVFGVHELDEFGVRTEGIEQQTQLVIRAAALMADNWNAPFFAFVQADKIPQLPDSLTLNVVVYGDETYLRLIMLCNIPVGANGSPIPVYRTNEVLNQHPTSDPRP